MGRQIALLRGINLGPSKRVKMADLRALCERLGYEDVATLLQSGNVVLSTRKQPATVAKELSRAIEQELGVTSAVVVRTGDELADVVARNPLADVAAEDKRLQVTFLEREAPAEVADRITAAAVAPERVEVSGREVYAWHPDGIARSDLAKLLADRRLGITATARNWNTVKKLLELAQEAAL